MEHINGATNTHSYTKPSLSGASQHFLDIHKEDISMLTVKGIETVKETI